jgi:hypothetical protein
MDIKNPTLLTNDWDDTRFTNIHKVGDFVFTTNLRYRQLNTPHFKINEEKKSDAWPLSRLKDVILDNSYNGYKQFTSVIYGVHNELATSRTLACEICFTPPPTKQPLPHILVWVVSVSVNNSPPIFFHTNKAFQVKYLENLFAHIPQLGHYNIIVQVFARQPSVTIPIGEDIFCAQIQFAFVGLPLRYLRDLKPSFWPTHQHFTLANQNLNTVISRLARENDDQINNWLFTIVQQKNNMLTGDVNAQNPISPPNNEDTTKNEHLVGNKPKTITTAATETITTVSEPINFMRRLQDSDILPNEEQGSNPTVKIPDDSEADLKDYFASTNKFTDIVMYLPMQNTYRFNTWGDKSGIKNYC